MLTAALWSALSAMFPQLRALRSCVLPGSRGRPSNSSRYVRGEIWKIHVGLNGQCFGVGRERPSFFGMHTQRRSRRLWPGRHDRLKNEMLRLELRFASTGNAARTCVVALRTVERTAAGRSLTQFHPCDFDAVLILDHFESRVGCAAGIGFQSLSGILARVAHFVRPRPRPMPQKKRSSSSSSSDSQLMPTK